MDCRIDCLNKGRAAELLGREYLAQVRSFGELADNFAGASASGYHGNPTGVFFETGVAEVHRRDQIARPGVHHLIERRQRIIGMGFVVHLEHFRRIDETGGTRCKIGQFLPQPGQLLQRLLNSARHFHVMDARLHQRLGGFDDVEFVLVEDQNKSIS